MTMLKNYSGPDYPDCWRLVAGGCSCHNSKRLRRKLKKSAHRREDRRWKREARQDY